MYKIGLRSCPRARRAGVACCMLAVCAVSVADDRAGTGVWTLGWVHIDPRSSSGPSTLVSYGGLPVYQPAYGTSVKSLSANTAVFAYERFWTDHFSTQLALGYPPTHKLEGGGTLKIFGVLGDGQQLSPAFIFKYNFGEPEQRLRPYVGLGINYTWYRKTRITNQVFQAASYGPYASTSVWNTTSWNPVYNIGLNYRLDDHWSVGLSMAYTPLKTRINVDAVNTQFGVPVTVVNELKSRTLATAVNVGYRF